MDFQALIKTDLNLLVTLHVLFEERSVSKSAERLFVTQSAVSKALSRMRERFNDPLFTRTGHQLVPTPYLQEKAPMLLAILDNISGFFAPQNFDPKTCQSEIRVTFPEMIDLVVTPRLLAYLRTEAPSVKIISEHYSDDVLDRLAAGEADFTISLEYSHYPPEYQTIPFLASSPVVVARKEHQLSGTVPNYLDLIEYPRIAVTLPDQSLTDFYRTFIAVHGNTSDWPSYFETESMLSALSIVRMTDYLLPVPDFVADLLIATTDLQEFRFPEYNQSPYKYVIVFHRRILDSPMHQWFCNILKVLGQDITANARL